MAAHQIPLVTFFCVSVYGVPARGIGTYLERFWVKIPDYFCLSTYEWQETGERGKQPYYIHAGAGEYFPFAGLYDIWVNPEGTEVYSCTIITTQPTVHLQPIHNRMPAILEPATEEVWLDPDMTDPHELTSLLHPYTIQPLGVYMVSKAVNRAGFDAPMLIQKMQA